MWLISALSDTCWAVASRTLSSLPLFVCLRRRLVFLIPEGERFCAVEFFALVFAVFPLKRKERASPPTHRSGNTP